MAIRKPRGFGRRHPAYQEIMEGQRPSIKGLKAAPFLPVAEIEQHHEDPIVIPAGTWVGVLSPGGSLTGSHAYPYATGASALAGVNSKLGHGNAVENYLVPAASDYYQVYYSTNDTSTTFYTPGTVDVDDLGNSTVVSSAGRSTAFVGLTGVGVKPLGVAYQDIYASWLGDTYTNYERQPNIGFLMRDYIIQVPVVTTNESLIEPGDLVAVDGFGTEIVADVGLTWDPTNTAVAANAMKVGHLVSVDDLTTSSVAALKIVQQHIVGRCVRKIKIAGTTSASNTALSADIPTSTSNVNLEYRTAGRVQTVDGLGLQGSGTAGIPGWLLAARARDGAYWALEIAVGTY